jgi:hypothetical protein
VKDFGHGAKAFPNAYGKLEPVCTLVKFPGATFLLGRDSLESTRFAPLTECRECQDLAGERPAFSADECGNDCGRDGKEIARPPRSTRGDCRIFRRCHPQQVPRRHHPNLEQRCFTTLRLLTEQAIGQSITLLIPPELQNEETMILERLRKGERILPTRNHAHHPRRQADHRLLDHFSAEGFRGSDRRRLENRSGRH